MKTEERVPNEMPQFALGDKRLAIIGEAPAKNEVLDGRPFTGASGRVLEKMLSRIGLARGACYIGNVSQHPADKIENLKWDGPEIVEGIAQLEQDLREVRPNIALLLGKTALRAFTGTSAISQWRGSLLWSERFGLKCLATFHPAALIRQPSWKPLAMFDLERAAEECETPSLSLPERQYELWLSKDEILERLDWIAWARSPMAFDIEGGTDMMTRCSIAARSDRAFVIPFITVGSFQSIWSEGDEQEIMAALKGVLEDPRVPKILQTYSFDAFVLAYAYGISIRGLASDTMVRWWELYSELDKSLAMQASLLTREPYFKMGRKADAEEEAREYSAKDAAITFECNEALTEHIPEDHRHFRFNVDMQEPLLYMQLKGFRYDGEGAQRALRSVERSINRLHYVLNRRAGWPNGREELFEAAKTALCYKKKLDKIEAIGDLVHYAKPKSAELAAELSDPSMWANTPSALGYIARRLDYGVNIHSPKQLQELWYKQLGAPKHYIKEGGRNTERLSTDDFAVLSIYKKKGWRICRTYLKLKRLATATQQLKAPADEDGRMRASYNVVGSSTGRISCKTAWTGNGYNLQTTSKRTRRFFLPDDDHWLFQCDLAGADGWTVAAYSSMLGDPTMLEDYQYGLKPAKIIALMYQQGAAMSRKSRQELAEDCKAVSKEGWIYFACKRVQHGSSYLMGKVTMSDQILEDSFKQAGEPTSIPPATCQEIQNLFFMRYPGVQWWHEWTKKQLREKGSLTAASGHKRIFFGPKGDHQTLKDALAELPQQNTTYATKLAIWNCWVDPQNRREDGTLVVEPLHTVHDSFICQAPKSELGFAQAKLRQWFDNTLEIAGHKIVIPAEMSYGPNWKDQTEF